MEALEVLFALNKLIELGFSVAEKVERGDMTKEEALAALAAGANDAAAENARFDRLTSE